jgi:hypothetical protein
MTGWSGGWGLGGGGGWSGPKQVGQQSCLLLNTALLRTENVAAVGVRLPCTPILSHSSAMMYRPPASRCHPAILHSASACLT